MFHSLFPVSVEDNALFSQALIILANLSDGQGEIVHIMQPIPFVLVHFEFRKFRRLQSAAGMRLRIACLKKNQNAPRPSEVDLHFCAIFDSNELRGNVSPSRAGPP